IKLQLSIINNEQMNKINTKFNTWQSYCKYLDEKIDKKIDEIKEQMITKEELKENNKMVLNEVEKIIQSSENRIMNEVIKIVQSLENRIMSEIRKLKV
ncbi:MAG: hypothetical protein LBS95_01625, partial [Mycoplasmataceae bacterium]|nr:hypothetical protein [Mycoplasmataceae bacterium]